MFPTATRTSAVFSKKNIQLRIFLFINDAIKTISKN